MKGIANKKAKVPAVNPTSEVVDLVPVILGIHKILVPIDFSPESKKALSYAVQFARQFDASITLIHVIEPLGIPGYAQSFPLGGSQDQLMVYCNERLQKLAAACDGYVGNVLVKYGRIFHEISDAAEAEETDLIIVSTHGYTGIKRAWLGSNTERVVRHARCPVLVVRPREHDFVKTPSKPKRRTK